MYLCLWFYFVSLVRPLDSSLWTFPISTPGLHGKGRRWGLWSALVGRRILLLMLFRMTGAWGLQTRLILVGFLIVAGFSTVNVSLMTCIVGLLPSTPTPLGMWPQCTNSNLHHDLGVWDTGIDHMAHSPSLKISIWCSSLTQQFCFLSREDIWPIFEPMIDLSKEVSHLPGEWMFSMSPLCLSV